MTDPRAALAESHDRVCGCGDPIGHDTHAALAEALAAYPYLVGPVADRLAERGVLLVTEERLAAALRQVPMLRAEEPIDYAAAIFAALSGAVTDVQPKLPAPRKPQP